MLPLEEPLLPSPALPPRWPARVRRACGAFGVIFAVASVAFTLSDHSSSADDLSPPKMKFEEASPEMVAVVQREAPPAKRRCEWVIEQVQEHDQNKTRDILEAQYALQASSVNMYYRGVDYMFWNDFLNHGWGDFDLTQYLNVADPLELPGGFGIGNEIKRTSAWTWITGDQHLSNFGAWKNRAGTVVFGVNDFDEAVVFDFQMDIWRLAVSIYDHALSNAYSVTQAVSAVVAFTDVYIDTLQGYVGNEGALLFEITQSKATGKLQQFLQVTESQNSAAEQLRVFTTVGPDGKRQFIKDESTKLRPIDNATRDQILQAWNIEGYGATLSKIGWHQMEFSQEYFAIIDMATRVGSGDGSFGATRYYLLIAGGDKMRPNEPNVILDVKLAPPPAMRKYVGLADAAWYSTLFHNEGSRVNLAQRALTTFTDPYTGWIKVNDEILSIRQRSPWKASFDLDSLTNFDEFIEFVQQTAIVTATSHARGTVARSPSAFKEVVTAVLGRKETKAAWGAKVAAIATGYREQLMLDYECFRDWVIDMFPNNSELVLNGGERAIRKHFRFKPTNSDVSDDQQDQDSAA
ncbi:hypothetical protein AB1Y20_021928 [Prymnesium parvum]|uniref:Phospholipase B-like n=1 Tax=Prymnesium parvum TaxID=97485 RepID=A0AB34JFR3_PRYPA